MSVWQAPDGRIVTDAYGAAWKRSTARGGRAYVVEPLGWGRIGVGPGARIRALLRRLSDIRTARSRPASAPGGEPAGYLHAAPAPGRRPLYSALHPALGDQLLSTSPDEAAALGYTDVTLLGYLGAAAPVTGTLGAVSRTVTWARELGLGRADLPTLAGALELPVAGTEVLRDGLRIAGWAVANGDRVRSVEVFADDKPLGRARLALPRGDLLRYGPAAASPDAILAGFELVRTSGQIEPGTRTFSALVTTMGGHTLLLESQPTRVIARGPARSTGPRPSLAGRGDPGARKLLGVTHGLDLGGAQRYFAEQVLELQRAGDWNCTVVAFRDGPWRAVLEQAGMEVHVTSAPPQAGEGEYEGRVAELHAWCASRGFSAAFVNTMDCFLAADLAKRMGLPLAWALHESFDPAAWWRITHRWQDDQAYSLGRLEQALADADVTIFAADATRRVLEPYIDAENAVTVPYGIDLPALDARGESFERERERLANGLDPDAKLVVCVALFEPRKAQALMTQAFSTIADRHPDAHLVLVGTRGDSYTDAIAHHAGVMGLSSRVHLVPANGDAYGWYLMADVVALASDVESMPLTLIEAMALARPVAASRVFGVPELIEDGRTGFLFEPSDLRELASALDRVLGMDPARLADVAAAGAEHVRERHSLPRYSEWLSELLDSLDGDRVGVETS